MRLSLKRFGTLNNAVAAFAAAAALLSASSRVVKVAAESGARSHGAAAGGHLERILEDATCSSERDAYSTCMDASGLQSCDSTCVASRFDEIKTYIMNFIISPAGGGYISCRAAGVKICMEFDECECVRPCYAEALDLVLCDNGLSASCADEIECSSYGSGSSSGGETYYDDDDATTMDDYTDNYGDDDDVTAGDDDITTMDDYSNYDGDDDVTSMDDYSNYNGDDGSSSGAGSNSCSSQLNNYYECLAANDIEGCDSCAGSAYGVIIDQLSSALSTTGSFGTCDSVSSYTCSVFQQCECLSPCLAETAAIVECDTQDIVGCDIDCASVRSFSSSRSGEGSDVVVSSSGTTGGGMANRTKESIPAEAAGGTSDAARVAARAHMPILIMLGTVASMGFGLVA